MSATDDRMSPVPTWKLERFALGELPAEELARLQERVDTDAELRHQVEALRAADAGILETYPAPWMARQILARAQTPATPARSWSTQMKWSLAPVAAVALVAIIAVPSLRHSDEAGEAASVRFLTEGVRIKGTGAILYAHRRTADGTERLQDGSVARKGDLVRLQYDAGGSTYGAILSIDGRGAVTRHLPLQGAAAAALTTGGTVALDIAYELDDAPAWERFFLVTGVAPFSMDMVVSAAEEAAAKSIGVASKGLAAVAPEGLELPEELEQTALTLIKVEAAPGAGTP